MELLFAPMEGVTSACFRKVHADFFPGADKYYAPFASPDSLGKIKASALNDLLLENNIGISLIPQILANNAQAFLALARELADIGYREVNLNAGCPSATVVSKHKGAGMLADLSSLDSFLNEVFSQCPIKVSVKTRIGISGADDFPRLLDIYGKYPISQLIIHVRDQKGQYKSAPMHSAFALAGEQYFGRLSYNGNIFSLQDMRAIETEFPKLESVMAGRGLCTNPALFREIRGGSPLQKEELKEYLESLLESYLASGLCGQYALARMKELWYYQIYAFHDCAKLQKQLNKAQRLEDYRSAVSSLFSSCRFDPSAGFGG